MDRFHHGRSSGLGYVGRVFTTTSLSIDTSGHRRDLQWVTDMTEHFTQSFWLLARGFELNLLEHFLTGSGKRRKSNWLLIHLFLPNDNTENFQLFSDTEISNYNISCKAKAITTIPKARINTKTNKKKVSMYVIVGCSPVDFLNNSFVQDRH